MDLEERGQDSALERNEDASQSEVRIAVTSAHQSLGFVGGNANSLGFNSLGFIRSGSSAAMREARAQQVFLHLRGIFSISRRNECEPCAHTAKHSHPSETCPPPRKDPLDDGRDQTLNPN